MKAFGFRQHGGLDEARILEVPEPVPGPGEVRLRMRVASLNHLDLFTLHGIEGVPVQTPHVLCGDGMGEVESLGEGARGPGPGERVLINPGLSDGTCPACRRGEEVLCRNYRIVGEHTQGVASELAVLPSTNLIPVPPGLDDVAAGTVALVFMTAWRALKTTGGLRGGERVAIVGAGGALSTAAIQIAHLLGAHVTVVTRDPSRGERARALGADAVFLLGGAVPLHKGLWDLSGKQGMDLIFDSTGTATVPSSVRALARGGRLVFCGATTGPLVQLDLRPLFWRNASVRGSTMGTREELREVLSLLSRGRLRAVVDSVVPLDEAPDALRRMDSGAQFGKLALRIG